MTRKKIDNRIRVLIENGVKLGHRTLFVIVGDKGRDQVVYLHHMLSKAEVKARPSVLWCYKKELGFSSHRNKRMKKLQHKIKAGKLSVNEDDPFELFVSSTKIRYCYYKETHKILGNTYGMCVLQDFEALTPNLLARTIETVEGGGLIVILLRTLTSLKQLFTMTMDVHQRYRTEAHHDVVCRFNERFLLSLSTSKRCLFVDCQLNVLPISSHNLHVTPVEKSLELSENEELLEEVKQEFRDNQPIGNLINCCKTLDQAKALLKFIGGITEKTLRSTVSLTAARGRGKSAALGLGVAAAVAFGYSNIYVTSPSPENLNTFFEFVFKGFDALDYQEHIDYNITRSLNPEFNKAVTKVEIMRESHRQMIEYIQPTESFRLSQAELVVIDEAAAIPLPYVKSMLGPYLVFLASTINGYEGTGRSLSLKLLQQLREQTSSLATSGKSGKIRNMDVVAASGRTLHEATLDEPIRYRIGDDVESWLNKLLCLDCTSVVPIYSALPKPDDCNLYYINRDTLFSFNNTSEQFLQRLVSLYVSSHYKNSPNDLQMMSDAPAHLLFCLLGPVDPDQKCLPEVLSFVQVCLEGEISNKSAIEGYSMGKRASGDLIPWTLGQQYDKDFTKLCGARIVRIATHPDCQGSGFGGRSLTILKNYYESKIPMIEGNIVQEEIDTVADKDIGLLEETIKPRKSLPPLLLRLNERSPEKLDYIGVSFGLTERLLKFWKKAGFVPLYLRQTTSELTGEHSCIMVKVLNYENITEDSWLKAYFTDFRKRFVHLLSYDFNRFSTSLVLGVISHKDMKLKKNDLTKEELDTYISEFGLRRLEKYSKNQLDYHAINNMIPAIAKFYLLNKLGDVQLTAIQCATLVAVGLQRKSFDELAQEFDIATSQLLGLFHSAIRKVVQYFNKIIKNFKESSKGNTEENDEDEPVKYKEKKHKKEMKKMKKTNHNEDSNEEPLGSPVLNSSKNSEKQLKRKKKKDISFKNENTAGDVQNDASGKMLSKEKSEKKIKHLIQNSAKLGHRNLFVIVGDKGYKQVGYFYKLLTKMEGKTKPNVLWCYKNEPGFKNRNFKQAKKSPHKNKETNLDNDQKDSFESFITSTKIKYCHYKDTQRILGNTYQMCVLQDFEALTPNILARTIETIEGGGVILVLLPTIQSLKELYLLDMDVHQKFRTESHQDVVCRFNQRFILSLINCKNCIFVNDQAIALPMSSQNLHVSAIDKTESISEKEEQLEDVKQELSDTQYIGKIIQCCKTLDQAKALLKFVDAITDKALRSTVSLTAARGRGKSAALGLGVAAAIAFGYSNVYVTSPTPENLNTFFEFVFKGFDALEWKEGEDYGLERSTNPEFNKAVIRVNVFREHRQTIQYIHPTDHHLLSQAELVVIDEAAAIPLPYVKSMLGPYLVFLASTINGYEGTGRSLSLKLLQQLRVRAAPMGTNTVELKNDFSAATGRALQEVTLEEPIRYRSGDNIEVWLNKLLCLDCTSVVPIMSGFPAPDNCDLYYIDRDTLFSYNDNSEKFLQRLVSLYVSSHYKNTPNDLQMMADAPAHHLFCLMGPVNPKQKNLPEILVFIQVCLEGGISERSVREAFSTGKRVSGDLVPWTIGQLYEECFPKLRGARVVRIATHPDYQGAGYGSRALSLLKNYYELKIPSLEENQNVSVDASKNSDEDDVEPTLYCETVKPRKNLPPLLLRLSERPPEKLDYLGVSFGLTDPLLKFWKKAGYVPLYLRQTTNDITGEHSCIMVRLLNAEDVRTKDNWLKRYWEDFRWSFVDLLGFKCFNKFPPSLALNVLEHKDMKLGQQDINKDELNYHITKFDLKRLEEYGRNLVDYHLILDLTYSIARLYFLNQMGDVQMSNEQSAILLGLGLQFKSVNTLSAEVNLPSTQLLALFNRSVRRCVKYFNEIIEAEIEQAFVSNKEVIEMVPLVESLDDELDQAAKQLDKKRKNELKKIISEDLDQYVIKGSEQEWAKVLAEKGTKNIISVKSGTQNMFENTEEEPTSDEPPTKKKKKSKSK